MKLSAAAQVVSIVITALGILILAKIFFGRIIAMEELFRLDQENPTYFFLAAIAVRLCFWK